MTRKLWFGCILFGLLAFATTGSADDPAQPQSAVPPRNNVEQPPQPQADQPAINPQIPGQVPPEFVVPEGWVPGMPVPPYPNYLGEYDYYYDGLGFNFGYGYRPLGYTFWPRYGDYTNFGRYFADPYRFYTPPYQWNPFWSYQRYREYPVW